MKELADSAAANDFDPMMVEVRSRFVADFPIRCDLAASLVEGTTVAATREKSSESLRTLAHRLAGLSGIVGFPQVSALAADLEVAATELSRGAEPAAARSLVDALRTAFAQELTEPPAPQPEAAPKVDRGRVLVAEDDDDQRALVLQQLVDAGYSARGVSSGAHVLDAARASRPSVILLDVEMPGLDGYSVCRELKADAALAGVPVVFMTSRGRLDDRLVGLTLGADDYLIKPVDARELVIRLDRVRSRGTERAEDSSADGVLPYEDFLAVARARLTRSAATLILMRVPEEHLGAAIGKAKDEIRRADLIGQYDRTHLLLFLPDLGPSIACTRAAQIIARLRENGISDVAAGVSQSPSPRAVWIESLLSDADTALMQARYCGKEVVLFGEAGETKAAATSAAVVLVADDDPDIMRILDPQLKGAGYNTKLAFDGAEALAALERHRPQVLLLDLMMPKLGGFDILAHLKSSQPPRPRVIVLSVRGRETDVTRAFELGADDYVTKPFNPQELLARVARLLR